MGTVDGTPGRGAVSIADRYGAVLLDIDGVVRRGSRPVVGAGATVEELRRRGIAVAFVTNNAAATPEAVAAELGHVGVAAEPAEIVTSAMAAATLLAPRTRCLVIGMDGLRRELAVRGCIEVDDPERADAVVVGFDRTVTWDDLRRATLALTAGARFLATNDDATFPAAEGLWPGNGAIVAALERASGRRAEVAGKPHAPLLQAAAQRVGRQPVLLVGDRHETDIVGAARLGWDTALVLTGVTARQAVDDLVPAPTYVMESVADLLREPPPVHADDSPLVRTATPADVPAIVALWDAAGMLSYTREPERDLRLVMDHDAELQVVAEVSGQVVGVAVGTSDGRRGWLMRVAVAPSARGTGVGRVMVEAVERRMHDRGVPQVDVLVFEGNTAARAFWKTLGYQDMGSVGLLVKPLGYDATDAC